MLQKLVGLKEKLVGITGSISGLTSFIGSWQVCHNICLGIIAFLSILGITIIGMPLLFLTKIAVPAWITAVVFLLISFGLYLKKECISGKLILFNSGLIIMGVPFQPLQDFSYFFWTIGGILILAVVFFFFKDKAAKGRNYGKGL